MATEQERQAAQQNIDKALAGARKAKEDFDKAYKFDAPTDKQGKFMRYNRFHKFEKRGMHFQLFEEIFSSFKVPEHPLVCVTPVVDGEIYSN